MKVALIGNMNNIFFTTMRYLRDLGVDAHLFMYQSEQELFLPENDTYNIDKYDDFIHTISVSTSAKGLIFANKNIIKKELKGYDFFIGCGIAPALFYKLNYQLDIFIPYGDEIELAVQENFKFKNIIKYIFRRYTVNQQIKGIQRNTTKLIASAIQEITKDTINTLNLNDKHIKNYLLMIYTHKTQEGYSRLEKIVGKRDLILFSNTRHHWTTDSLTEEFQIKDGGKAQDKLINGYKLFIENNPNVNIILVLFKYGKDVNATKELIKLFGIEDKVVWLNQMPRKEILELMKDADLVVNSLSSSMWGGVGWETFSCGKVLIQNILQTDEEYCSEMGHNPPFILRANNAEGLAQHLSDFRENREFFIQKSKDNKIWFDKYAGIGLSKEYKTIIEELYREKVK